MNSKGLLNKLSDYLNMGKKKRSKYEKELIILLKELKSKEKKLITKCSEESSKNLCSIMKKEIAILHAKRKKGLKALKKLTHKN